MNEECHALLKGVCALKSKTIGDYVYEIISEDFDRLVREDKQVQSMFLSGQYKEGSPAFLLKQSLMEELNSTNDPPA